MRKLILACGWMLAVVAVQAQFVPKEQFGTNLVQDGWKRKWKAVSGEKVDIFYYGDNRALAETALRYAEAGHDEVAQFFEHEPTQRIQIHVYPTPYQHPVSIDAEGLNAQQEFPVNIGSTYYTGSQATFAGAIRTEVARLMMQDAFYGAGVYRGVQNRLLLTLPEWFVTGVTAYLGEGWTPQDEMYLRSLNLPRYTNLLTLEERSMRTRILKKSLWRYIAVVYGPKKVNEIVYMARVSRSVDGAISGTLGVNMRAFASRWELWVRDQYLDKRVDIPERLRRVDPQSDKVFVAAAKPNPQGRFLAQVIRKGNVYQVQVLDMRANKVQPTPIRGRSQTGSQFDLQLPFPIAWNPKGNQVMVGLPDGKGQTLFLYNLGEAAIEKFEVFPNVDWVQDIAISAKGKIAASALKGGRTNLYLLNPSRKSGEATFSPLTNDYFDNLQPTWEPDDAGILFVSNRDSVLDLKLTKPDFAAYYNRTDLYRFDVKTRKLTRLTETPSINEFRPQWSDSGLVCLTDQSGLQNVIRVFEGGTRVYLTDFTPGVADINFVVGGGVSSPSPRLRKSVAPKMTGSVLLTAPVNGSLHIYRYDSLDWGGREQPFNTKLADDLIADFRTWYSNRLKLRMPPPKKPAAPAPEPEPEPEPAPEPVPERKQRFYVFDEDSPPPAPAQPRRKRKLTRERFTELMNREPEAMPFDINGVKVKRSFDAEPSVLLRKVEAPIVGISPFYGFYFEFRLRMEDPFRYHLVDLSYRQYLELRSFDVDAQYLFRKWRLQLGGGFIMRWRFLNFPNQPLRYNSTTANVFVRYPLGKFQRVEGGFKFVNINRIDLRFDDETNIDGQANLAGFNVGYTFDNTRVNQRFITSGIRANVQLNSYLNLNQGNLQYSTVTGDVRGYVPIFRKLVLALRFAAGFALDNVKPTFALGGLDQWIGGQAQNFQELPAAQRVADLHFTELVTPMHGFNFNARNGSNYSVLNAELRVPIVKLFNNSLTSKRLYNVQFVAFYDIGTAWRQGNPFSQRNPIDVTTINRPPFLITVQSLRSPWLQAFGTGLRALIFGYYLKGEVAWGVEDGLIRRPLFTLTLGTEF